MKRFTTADIRKWNPCYDPSRYLAETWQGTAIDILNDNRIPFKDRLWVIMRKDLVSEKLMRRFAVWCARQVQRLITDERSLHALDVAEAYAENRWLVDDADYAAAWEDELGAARAAAWAVAQGATLTAEWAAVGAAAGAARVAAGPAVTAAAEDAAWAVALAAWRNAASDAAWNVMLAAARAAQERKLREMLIAGVKTGDVK
jgi:hypothetical protein